MSRNIAIQLSETVSLEMIFVQGTGSSTFIMGENSLDNSLCEVTVPNFWIGKYPLTQAQWKEVMGDKKPNPSSFKDENCPVDNVSWFDAIQFIKNINKKIVNEPILTDKNFILPTEAQWEYAARGGIHWLNNFKYAGSNILLEVGWYANNSQNELKPVGLKLPNQLGIYDMSGNVWEWCVSKYEPNLYEKRTKLDRLIEKQAARVLRGGSSIVSANNCTCTYRMSGAPLVRFVCRGFRLCLVSF